MAIEQKILPFVETGFLTADDVPKRDSPPEPFQKHLNRIVEKKVGKKGKPGELVRLIHMGTTSETLAVVTFNITDGQQIGFSVLTEIPKLKKPKFLSTVSIASSYEGQGYGFLTLRYLSTLNAARFRRGTDHLEVITADFPNLDPKELSPMEKMMVRFGGVKDAKNPKIWEFHVANPGKEIPLSVDARGLVFKARGKELAIPEGVERKGDKLLYEDIPVGDMGKRAITVYQMEDPNPEFWVGVDALWKGAKKAGLRVDLRFGSSSA